MSALKERHGVEVMATHAAWCLRHQIGKNPTGAELFDFDTPPFVPCLRRTQFLASPPPSGVQRSIVMVVAGPAAEKKTKYLHNVMAT